MSVTPEQAGWTLALIIVALVYVGILLKIWHPRHIHHLPITAETKPETSCAAAFIPGAGSTASPPLHNDAKTSSRAARIAAARDLITEFLNAKSSENFKGWVKRQRAYLDIEPFLGEEYKQWLKASVRTAYATAGRRPYEVTRFAAEIARIEAEWNL